MKRDIIELMAIVGGIVLPLFNVPLIARIARRKSSADMSLTWAVGVWVCIILMTPQALRSSDFSYRIYGAINIIFFTVTMFFIIKYRAKN